MPVYGFRAPAFLPQELLRLLLGVRASKVITTKTLAKLAILTEMPVSTLRNI
jgi:hypothetical protein